MTLAPDAPPLECRTVAAAVAVLRDRGLRLSTARRLVLEALFAADGPVSAEHVSRRLRLDLSSVYRNLELLESHGLVRHVHLGHGPGLYALRGHGEQEYLYCERCGAVHALPPEELDLVREHVRQRFGYEARFTHFPIVGTCPACYLEPSEAVSRHPHQGATMDEKQHQHDHPHTHEHQHDDGTTHAHAHTEHEHDHVEHEHEHSHGDQVHSHPHTHQEGIEDQHQHAHQRDAS
jgi:Fur family ferric uptake transcriptional regulator